MKFMKLGSKPDIFQALGDDIRFFLFPPLPSSPLLPA
jgi:hypothetical protein